MLDFTPFGMAHAVNASMQLAPADRLFGRYQMSVVGIGNAISRYDGTTRLDDGPIAYAIVAIRDWEKCFPRTRGSRATCFICSASTNARTLARVLLMRSTSQMVTADYPGRNMQR